MQTNLVRIPARRRGVFRKASLWDAGDYLLSVSGTSFSESYRRFYYRDIKAIVVQNGPRMGSIGAMVLTAFACMMLLIYAANPMGSSARRWLWLIPVGWFAWMLITNLAFSCRVFVYTAVSSEELPAVFRRRSAARVLPIVLSKIAAVQGSLGEAGSIGEGAVPVFAKSAELTVEELVVGGHAVWASAIFFVALLGSAGFAYWYSEAALTPALLTLAKVWFCVLNAVEVGAGIWALVGLKGRRLFAGWRVCIFSGLGEMAIRTYALLIVLTTLNLQRGAIVDTMPAIYARRWIGTGDCVLSLLLGIAGLIFLLMASQDQRTVPISGGALSDL